MEEGNIRSFKLNKRPIEYENSGDPDSVQNETPQRPRDLKKTFPESDKSGGHSMKKNENLITEAGETMAFFGKTVNEKLSKDQFIEMLNEDEDASLGEFEDGRKSRLEFQKLQVIDIATGIISMLGVALAVMAYDIEFDERDKDRLLFFNWMQFGTTLVAIGLNFMRHHQKLRFNKAQNLIPKKATIISSGYIYHFFPEMFIQLLQPYPFLQYIQVNLWNEYYQIPFYYHVNDFLYLLTTFRIYIILRFVLNTTKYRSPSAHRLAQNLNLNMLNNRTMYGADNGYLYACKSLMKAKPFTSCMIMFISSIFVFGFMLRICERYATRSDFKNRPLNRNPEVTMDYGPYWNPLWNVIVTMTTVGYGDYYPRTILGRAVTFFICLWGVFVVSLMVVTLTNTLTMSPAEDKVPNTRKPNLQALTVLERLELRKDLRSEAAYVLTNMGKIAMNNRREKDLKMRLENNRAIFSKIKVHLSNCKRLERQIRSLDASDNISEEMTRQFEYLRDEIKTINERQNRIQRTIKQLCSLFGIKKSAEDDKDSDQTKKTITESSSISKF